ncbi:MAG: hypothetical protein JRH20_18460 [Deltaproteobacteria bacterium]|nr:hypothetical protein [Deltaproteobacteria bacterium]
MAERTAPRTRPLRSSTSGDDPDAECLVESNECGGCDGEGACFYAAATTDCGTTNCLDGKTISSHCDGEGRCVSEEGSCGGYACADSANCLTTCAGVGDTDCIKPYVCFDTECVADQEVGALCGNNWRNESMRAPPRHPQG